MIITGIDIETTGLEWAAGHRIIEVAACVYDLRTEERKGKFVKRINPNRPIDAKAQAVHGITFEQLVGCPVWENVAPDLAKILKASNVVVAHNGLGFDMPFIKHEMGRIGIEIPDIKVVDTCIGGRWATPMGKIPNLKELCFACQVKYDPDKAHGAEYDVDVMMKCFFHAHKKGFFAL